MLPFGAYRRTWSAYNEQAIDPDPCATCGADPMTFTECPHGCGDSVCPNCHTCDNPKCEGNNHD